MVFIWGDIDKFGQVIHGWLTLLLLLFDQHTSAQQIALLSSWAGWEEETKPWVRSALSQQAGDINPVIPGCPKKIINQNSSVQHHEFHFGMKKNGRSGRQAVPGFLSLPQA